MTQVLTRPPSFAFDEDRLRRATPFALRPTALHGVFTGPALARDFNPDTASPADLVRAGLLWRRPDAGASPGQQAAWKQVTSRQWRPEDRIVPEFAVQEGRTHILRQPPRRQADASYLTNAWAGAGIKTGKWTGVIGFWHIPTVSRPPEPQGNEGGWNSSSWIGLDGFFVSNDVLQAGVQQHVNAQGQASYVAWYEWFAPPQSNSPGYIWQTNITNFPVSPGQQVYCSVQYTAGNTAGYLYFANETTGQHFSITLAPPPGAGFNGSSVEWIMEAPDGGEPTSALPRFTPVTFTSALACGAANASGNPQTGDVINIDTAAGRVLTSTTVGQDTATVSFTG
ncbi:G1 family glutamic endopeptidase [Acidisphaera rubrifaciens]|uniref:Uncharacterized protein n=1 Tax=Acidisphaera rubrifaciens HS-AP3 TaxID=1231350 RepID=A0A0D6PCH1_9PROT|nr:G1 family glutamic endopeptidase [Acidisphaera rubrifaciens]GAN78559.1 hypothetical protein Asru_1134_01 [Acidisphaera rubrifaciens HS-AP3]